MAHDCGNCGGCTGGCAGCGGCRGALELNAGELEMLDTLARIPFLPVARRADSEEPVYLESMDATVREYALILLCLEKKNLVSIDYSAPLKGFSYAGYEKYPVKGSVGPDQPGPAGAGSAGKAGDSGINCQNFRKYAPEEKIPLRGVV